MQRIRWIEVSNEPASARLSRDDTPGRVSVALCRSRCLSTRAVGAPINVADLHSSLLVNGHVKEVEQIAANIGATVAPDATALHWVFRCYVGRGPVQSSIECICNVKMPDTSEVVCRTVSGCSRTVES